MPRSKQHSPSMFWTLLEFRWLFESLMFRATRPFLKRLPKGNGQPVIVYPGFLGNEKSTRPLRRLLDELGYVTYDWGLGRNLRFNDDVEAFMLAQLEQISIKHDCKVSLIGWSLGGVFAREIAKSTPQFVRSVITLGSPITGHCRASFLKPIFEYINGRPSPQLIKRINQLTTPPPVPTSAIYSKSDGIIHWLDAVQTETSLTENIRVSASHSGMGAHPAVVIALANCLTMPAHLRAHREEIGMSDLAFGRAPNAVPNYVEAS